SEFLLDYVGQRLTEDDSDIQDLREAQEWTALAYTKPSELARKLAEALSERVKGEDMGEVLRLTSLVETFAEPLVEAGFEPLLIYADGMTSFVRGSQEDATAQFSKLPRQGNQVEIAGVPLLIPESIRMMLSEPSVDDVEPVAKLTEEEELLLEPDLPPVVKMPDETVVNERKSLVGRVVSRLGLWLEELTSPFQREYYQSLIYSCRDYQTQGLDKDRILKLEKVFVPFRIVSKEAVQVNANMIQQVQSRAETYREKRIWDFLAAMGQYPEFRRIAVLGAPGSGKTTLLRYLTLTYSASRCYEVQ
ncbi:MAG: hypothetical protein F6J86_37065, partial [Symploca sp. SIO1B1]|nr:hypothetical protein [Symploca sp. SIO1B1]